MKTIDEALNYTLQVLRNLELRGVFVEITPCELSQEDIDEMELKDRLRLDLKRWSHVTLIPNGANEIIMIQTAESELANLGISFDTGSFLGGVGCRDWELDWSFDYQPPNNEEIK